MGIDRMRVINCLIIYALCLTFLSLGCGSKEEKKERYLQIIEKGALRIKENMERFFNQPDSVFIEK